MKKNMIKRVLSTVMALSLTGSMITLAQAAAPQPAQENDTVIWYQNENYEGDISWFNVDEYAGNAFRGTRSVLKKVKDPADPEGNNYVLMAAGVGKTSPDYPKNTSISLYQGDLQPIPSVRGTLDADQLNLKGYLVFETKAYFDKGLNPYINKSYEAYLLPSKTTNSSSPYPMFYTIYMKGLGDYISLQDGKKGVKVQYDTWNTWKYVYDCATRETWFYLNDELYYNDILPENGNKPAVNVGITFFTFGGNGTPSGLVPENLLYFDDTKCYNYVPAAGTDVSFNSASGRVDLKFNTEVSALTEENLLLKNNGEAADVSSVISNLTLADDKLSASFDVDLTKLNGNSYTVALTGVKDRFEQDITMDELALTLPDAGAAVESIDYETGIVRLRFATPTDTFTLDNVVVKENGTAVSGKVTNVALSETSDYADVTVNMSNIGAAATTVELTGVTDRFGQTVALNGNTAIAAPEFTFEAMNVENANAVYTFNQKIGYAAADNITVKDEKGSAVSNAVAEVTAADKTVTVKFTDKVKYGKEYMIDFNGLKDVYSSEINVTDQSYTTVLTNVLYNDDYSTLNPEEFDLKQQFGWSDSETQEPSNDMYKSFIVQADDPTNPGNKVATVYSTGKTDKKYPYATAIAIAKSELMTKLSGLATGSKTDNYICYETDMYLSSDLLRVIGSNAGRGLYLGVGPRADGYGAYPMFFNTSIVSNGSEFAYASSMHLDMARIAFKADTWNNFKFIIDHKNGKVSYFVNDVPMFIDYESSNMGYTNNSCAGITLWYDGKYSNNYLIPENKIFFDNTKVYEVKKRSGVTEIRPNSFTRSVEIEFNTPVTENSLNKIRIFDDAGEITEAISKRTLSADGYVAELFFTDSLHADKTYSINFDADFTDMYTQPANIANGTYTYTVPKSKAIFVVDNSLKCIFDDNGIPTVSFKVDSYDSESSAWIGVGFYDKYNSLIDYASDTISEVTAQKDVTYTLTRDCSEAVKYGLFVWDGIDTMVPLQRAEFKQIVK